MQFRRVGWIVIAFVAAGCSAAQIAESAHPTEAGTATQVVTPTPTPVATTPTTSPQPSSSSPSISGLEVEGFADVVADRLQMRAAPGLAAEVVRAPLHGDYPPGTEFPPVTVGRDTEWTQVYLLDGPVAADGFEWYLAVQAAEAPSSTGFTGWVAAGDAEDAWLVPATVSCPDDPVELADVTISAMSRLEAIHCLGGRELTLRGYYVSPPDESGEGECVAEPAWLVCSFGWHGLRTLGASWAGDANHLPLHLHPDLGPMPPRPGWIEVTGQFDHPAAAHCGEGGGPAPDLGCRMEFVVTGAAPAAAP